jgi:uncharacterized protein (DUF305 family)
MNATRDAMSTLLTRRWGAIGSHCLALIAGLAIALSLQPAAKFAVTPGASDDFHRAIQAVMVEMSASMCITSNEDADRDFARTMIPHHRGAVEIAQLELLHGRDPRLRRLAQGIVIEQSQEIELMRSILANPQVAQAIDRNPLE